MLECCFCLNLALDLQNVRFAYTKRSFLQALRRHLGAQIEVQERLEWRFGLQICLQEGQLGTQTSCSERAADHLGAIFRAISGLSLSLLCFAKVKVAPRRHQTSKMSTSPTRNAHFSEPGNPNLRPQVSSKRPSGGAFWRQNGSNKGEGH